MSEYNEITAVITTEEPEVAADLDELRYLVFQGMAGKSPRVSTTTGNWEVYDNESQDWVDTGISASADITPEQLAQAIEDYFDEHPVVVEETDPNAVHFDTAQTFTEAEKAQARQNIGAGTYSKPSGGIPASDLASGVIPSVPQMATQANMSDWTSGKTVDAAAMKTVVTSAGLKVSALEDDVSELARGKANTSDIPTAVSELTNDSGFITAQEAAAAAPVQSVNGMAGAVTIPTGDPNAVLYTPQTPTDAQQEQARGNIGAAASATLLSMLIPILRDGLYGTDQTAAINALEVALGGTPEPEDPIETYTPEMTEGYINVTTGATGGTSTYKHTEIIPVREGDKVYGTSFDSTYNVTIPRIRARFTAAYDANGAIYPAGGSSTQADYEEGTPFVVPAGVYGVVFSIVNSLATQVTVYVDKSERVGA